jgi:intein/homing endonuclease
MATESERVKDRELCWKKTKKTRYERCNKLALLLQQLKDETIKVGENGRAREREREEANDR